MKTTSSSVGTAFDATLGFGHPAARPAVETSVANDPSATIVSPPDAGTADTLVHSSTTAAAPLAPATTVRTPRTTVLPRVEWDGSAPALDPSPRPRFEQLRTLGEGGVGEVTLAHDNDIDRDVAVKRLHPQFDDVVSLVRFADEVRIVGRLEHPNIAPVHDVGADERGHYFLMKYVEGDTVERVIEKLRANDPAYVARFGIEARVEIFRGVLRALQYAHARGVIHRDVKPSNVMVGPFGEVVLMDWGIARQLDRTVDPVAASADAQPEPAPDAKTSGRAQLFRTRQGAVIGTPAYMAPEQARGENAKVDHRSDLYSACVLFHELLTLEHHLPGVETVTAVLAAVAEYEPTVADSIRVGLRANAPMEFMHVLRKGMANDPAARFQSASEVLERLTLIAQGEAPIQCPVTLAKRAGGESMRMLDRHPTVVLMGAFAGFAAAVAGVVATVSHVLPMLGH